MSTTRETPADATALTQWVEEWMRERDARTLGDQERRAEARLLIDALLEAMREGRVRLPHEGEEPLTARELRNLAEEVSVDIEERPRHVALRLERLLIGRAAPTMTLLERALLSSGNEAPPHMDQVVADQEIELAIDRVMERLHACHRVARDLADWPTWLVDPARERTQQEITVEAWFRAQVREELARARARGVETARRES